MVDRFTWSRSALRALALGSLLLVAACDTAEERAEKHYQSGVELLEAGELQKALLEFRNTLKLEENHVPARYEIAKAYEADGELRAAVGNYRFIIEIEAEHVDSRIALARIMLAANQLDEALKQAMSAFQIAPNRADVLTTRAAVAMRLDDDATAREAADAALVIDPSNVEANLVLAGLANRDGNAEEAERLVDDALALQPDSVPLQLFKMRLVETRGANDELGPILQNLRDKNPEVQEYAIALARWHVSQANPDAAEQILRDLVAAEPTDTDRALTLVRFVVSQRGNDAALEELRGLVKSYPDIISYKLQLAGLQFSSGARDEAVAYLEELLGTVTDDVDRNSVRTSLAGFLIAMDRKPEAVDYIERTLAEDEKNVSALTLRGRLAIDREDPEAAILDLRTALSENPEDAEILMLLATAHARNGSPDLARERLGAAMQASDFAIEPTLRYSQLLINDGKPELAEDFVRQSLGRNPNNRRLLASLARIRILREDWLGAEQVAEAMRNLGEDDGSADQVMAAIRSGQQRFDESIELLQGNVGSERFSNSSMSTLVRTYVSQGDVQAAKDFLDGVLTSNEDNAQAHLLYAALHAFEGRTGDAETSYKAAIAAEPETSATYRSYAAFQRRSLDQEGAEKTLREGLSKLPESSALRFDLAVLLELTGRQDEAIDEYKILYEAQPGSTIIANNYASLLADFRGDPESVEIAVRVARRLRSSEVAAFQDTYGWVMHLAGEPNRAIPALQRAAEGLADNQLVQYHLGAAYAAIGEVDRATEALEKSVELAGDHDPRTSALAQEKLEELKTVPQETQ